MSLTKAMELHWHAHIGLPQMTFIKTEQFPSVEPNYLIDVYKCHMCPDHASTVCVLRRKGQIIKRDKKDEQENSGN